MKKLKIKIVEIVEIDLERWAREFHLDANEVEVAADVRKYCEHFIQGHIDLLELNEPA
jgi:hypothetical protein